MSHKAFIAFARAYDSDWLDRQPFGSGQVFMRHGVRWLPSKTSVPLVCDHDMNRMVGEVTDIHVWPWVDGSGSGRWLVAECTVTDPPSWLRRGTGASWCYRKLNEYETWREHKWSVVTSALIDEVTVCSPTHKPMEPGASVLTFERSSRPAAAPPAAAGRAAEGEVIYGGQIIRRNIGQILRVR